MKDSSPFLMQRGRTACFFIWKKILFPVILLFVALLSRSQETEKAERITHFNGSISLTQNGISLVPTFSLGKPASILLLSIGGERLSFDPDIRFALAGKPWSMLFWLRYKLIHTGKFRLGIGAHPALNFKTSYLPVNGDSAEVIMTRRFLAGEISPNYIISENLSVGMYYLYGRGFESSVPKNSHFITLNSHISNIPVPGHLLLRLDPQLYYLKQDNRDGYYIATTITLSRRNFPFSVSAILNKTIDSRIIGNKDFVWNTSLVYSFAKNYVRK